ncbi:aminoglycoside phosphotransferase family protein [Paenibacillus sp. QZ-Y1]|uniref:aminoglycoside phosphotransferase family protein n=1 Tax=Paenibacillus sp. QZ-Y1 TaxID=3414511 RepID=UPI003F78F087
MIVTLDNIHWVTLDEGTRSLMKQHHKLVPLSPGLEADVVKIDFDGQSYVLKVWNKESKPNIRNQFQLLSELYQSGIPVSKPYGWGTDNDENQVLLTSYDGEPITKLNKSKLNILAEMLIKVHAYNVNDADIVDVDFIAQYDFIEYFFPSIELHKDIQQILESLLQRIEYRQDKLIHGDYNLGNILEAQDHYAVIDWTNGQLGDPRYDIAWSIFLMNIYVGERNGKIYLAQFQSLTLYTPEDAEVFEAIACLRWILLKRVAHVPDGPNVMKRIGTIVQNNPYLNETLL